MYDTIVIGARASGGPTAMLLAQQDHRVLLVDRATFPSDTMSTHGIPYRGLVKVKKCGLYEKILVSNCPEVRKITQDMGDFPLTGQLYKVETSQRLPVCRVQPMVLSAGVTGTIAAMPHWAGESVDGVKGVQTAVEIIHELVDNAEQRLRWC